MKKITEKYETNALRYDAIRMTGKAINPDDLMRNDYTHEFYNELVNIIKNKELINLSVVGRVTTGKSTVAAALTNDINQLLNRKMSTKYIAHDQFDFLRKTRTDNQDAEEYNQSTVMVDEYNALSDTGLNSSVEKAYLQAYSDIAAQRYLHKISCAPRKVEDINSDIILETESKNTKSGKTRCWLYYRLNQPTGQRTQQLGYIDIRVSHILQETWYQGYRNKKFKKIALFTKYGIRDARDLEYPEIIWKAAQQLKKIALLGQKPTTGTIKETLDEEKKATLLSIFGTEDMIRSTDAIISNYWTIGKIQQKLEKAKKQTEKQRYQETINELQKIINKTEKRYKEKINMKQEYQKIIH